jgi:hypothetical protein
MHKSTTKCNETVGKWCKNKHRASKIIDTLETYHMPLYKVPLSLGPASWEHMPPPLPQILLWRKVLPVGSWRSSVAGVTPASFLCRSCRGHAAFGKAFVRGIRRLHRLGPLRMKSLAGCWRSRPFDGRWPPWPNVVVIPGMRPTDGSALGLPEYSSPRQ